MWKQKTKPLTAREVQTLKAVRRQQEIVSNARRRCNEIVSAHGRVKSPRLDGMPRGSNTPCGLDGSAAQADALLAILKREEAKLKQCRTAAQRIINRLPPALYGFCMYYYMEGMSVQRAAAMIDRSEAACWGYKAFIEQAVRAENTAG